MMSLVVLMIGCADKDNDPVSGPRRTITASKRSVDALALPVNNPNVEDMTFKASNSIERMAPARRIGSNGGEPPFRPTARAVHMKKRTISAVNAACTPKRRTKKKAVRDRILVRRTPVVESARYSA